MINKSKIKTSLRVFIIICLIPNLALFISGLYFIFDGKDSYSSDFVNDLGFFSVLAVGLQLGSIILFLFYWVIGRAIRRG